MFLPYLYPIIERGRCQGEKHRIKQEKDKVSTRENTGLDNAGFSFVSENDSFKIEVGAAKVNQKTHFPF